MSLQERLETIRSSPTPRGEEQAKFQIIAPILQNLDWDPYGPEVLYEHPVGGKGSGGRVDIALRSSGRVVALIEAKAPSANLDKHVEQVLNYAFHDGMDICVLTTGLVWWLYLPLESGPPADRRFAILSIRNQPVEQLAEDLSAFLGKDNLVSGKAKQRAQLVLKAKLEAEHLNKEIPSIWTQMLNEPDEELVELLSKRVYDNLNLRPTKQQVVAALQGLPIPTAAVPPATPEAVPPKTEQKPATKRASPKKPRSMVLWGKEQSVSSTREVLLTVVDSLYEQHLHDFDRILQIRGKKFPYAALDPATLRTGEYREVNSSGYFIDVHLSAKDAIRRATQFLQLFGHTPSDLEVRYD